MAISSVRSTQVPAEVDTPLDWLDDGEGYLNWLEQAHLVPGDDLRDMCARALPNELDEVVRIRRGACGNGSGSSWVGIRAAP